MKCMVVFIFSTITATATSFAQYQPGFLPEFFFGRQPSARAEAMGKAYTSVDGDMGSVYFNPAGLATAKRIEINTSYTPPGYYSSKGYYTFYGLSYKAHKYFQISVSQFQFNLGKTPIINATKTPYVESNSLTISSEPIKNLLVGLNANYFIWQPGIDKTSKTLYFDFGLIKIFPIFSTKQLHQTLKLATSVSNVNYASTTAVFNNISEKYHMPVITRYGASYQAAIGRYHLFDSTNFLKYSILAEYQLLLNSSYRSAIKFGCEITWANFLSIRTGWYREKVYDFGLPDENNNSIAGLTYGAGLRMPLYSVFKVPFTAQFDFTSLPQVSYSKNKTSWANFNTYGVSLMYSLF